MNAFGIILLLLTLITCVSLCCTRNFWFRLNQKKPWVFIVISIIILVYFVGARYGWDIKNLVDVLNNKNQSSNQLVRSIALSKVLLLDMCPLIAVLLPIVCIFDKKKAAAKVLCPIGIIGSSITIFGQSIFDHANAITNADEFFRYLFIGIGNDRMYFMMHFLTLALSIIILGASTKFDRWSLFGSVIFYLVWFIYVLSMVKILNITSNATGMVEFDWINPLGQYHKVWSMFKIPFPFVTVFWYAIALISNFLITLIKNRLTFNPDKVKYFGDKRFWVSNIWKL